MAEIVIKASPSKAVDVELVGVTYKVKPPKMAVMAVVAKAASDQGTTDGTSKLIAHLEDLVKLMFGKAAASVLARLEDPTDLLDYEHITDVAGEIIEVSSGNPTT